MLSLQKGMCAGNKINHRACHALPAARHCSRMLAAPRLHSNLVMARQVSCRNADGEGQSPALSNVQAESNPFDLAAAAFQQALKRQAFILAASQDEHVQNFAHCILKPALEAAGTNVFLEQRSNSLAEVINAAVNSDVVVVVFSKQCTQSFSFMLTLALALQSNKWRGDHGRKLQLVPVFYHQPEDIIPQGGSWDACIHTLLGSTDHPWMEAFRSVAANIESMCSTWQLQHEQQLLLQDWKVAAQPIVADPWQLARQATAAAVQAVPRLLPVDTKVVGFEQQEEQLVAKLASSDELGVWLCGPGGSGCSTLAALLFKRLSPRFQHSVSITLEHSEGSWYVGRHLHRALQALGVPTDENVLKLSNPGLLELLQATVLGKPVLYLLDNVETASQLDQLLPLAWGQGSVVLITSRLPEFPDCSALQVVRRLHQHQLGPLDDASAQQLLRWHNQLDAASLGLEDLEREILNACQGLPAALKRVRAQLGDSVQASNPRAIWEAALIELQHGTLSEQQGEGHEQGYTPGQATQPNLNGSIIYMGGTGSLAEKEGAFRHDLAMKEELWGLNHPETAAALSNLAAVLQAQFKLDEAEQLYVRALDIRYQVWESSYPGNAAALPAVMQDSDSMHLSVLAIQEVVPQADIAALVAAVSDLGGLLLVRAQSQLHGRHWETGALLESALTMSQLLLGLKHPLTATIVNNMAGCLTEQKDTYRARAMYEQALAVREMVCGANHLDTATSLHDLACLLLDEGSFGEVTPMLMRALAIREQVLGPNHLSTAASMRALASALEVQGKLAAAEPLYRQALAVAELVLGPDHPDMAAYIFDLASVLHAQGKLAAAEPLQSRALSIEEQLYVSNRSDHGKMLFGFAGVLQSSGDMYKAKAFHERALSMRRQGLGDSHPLTATSYHAVAEVLAATGNLQEAEASCRAALAIRRQVLGALHPDTVNSYTQLAQILKERGDPFTGKDPPSGGDPPGPLSSEDDEGNEAYVMYEKQLVGTLAEAQGGGEGPISRGRGVGRRRYPHQRNKPGKASLAVDTAAGTDTATGTAAADSAVQAAEGSGTMQDGGSNTSSSSSGGSGVFKALNPYTASTNHASIFHPPCGVRSMSWFDKAFKDYLPGHVPWGVFWHEMAKAVKPKGWTGLGDERWRFYEHRLVNIEQRQRFQDAVSRVPGSSSVSREEFDDITQVTDSKLLAEVIDLAMRSKWSECWYGGEGQGCMVQPIKQAPAGSHIVRWCVQTTSQSSPSDDTAQQAVVAVNGQYFQEAPPPYMWINPGNTSSLPSVRGITHRHLVPDAAEDGGFNVLWGCSSSDRLASFMGVPDSQAEQWSEDAAYTGMAECRAVGYQLRRDQVTGLLDSARFLFRSLAPTEPGELQNAVFISHTGQDAGAAEFTAALYQQLTHDNYAAFFDAASLHPGAGWRQMIMRWAVQSKVFVAIISPTYPARKWPLLELHLALRYRPPAESPVIIPVLFNVKRSSLSAPGQDPLSQAWVKEWEVLQEADTTELQQNPAADLQELLDVAQTSDGAMFALGSSKRATMDLGASITEAIRMFI